MTSARAAGWIQVASLIALTATGCGQDRPNVDPVDAGAIDAGQTDGGQDAAADGGHDDGGHGDGGQEDGGQTDGGDDGSDGDRSYALSYRYGNQIFGSELTVQMTAGEPTALWHTERSCCPPKTDDAGVPDLTPQQALALYSAMVSCHGRPVQPVATDGGAAGDLYGEYLLHREDAGVTVLRQETLSGTQRNTCAALPELIDFANAIVDHDMPRED